MNTFKVVDIENDKILGYFNSGLSENEVNSYNNGMYSTIQMYFDTFHEIVIEKTRKKDTGIIINNSLV